MFWDKGSVFSSTEFVCEDLWGFNFSLLGDGDEELIAKLGLRDERMEEGRWEIAP